MEESAQSVSLASISVVVILRKQLWACLIDIADEDIDVGDGVVRLLPDGGNGRFYRGVLVVKLVGITPAARRVDIVTVGEDFGEADTHVQTIHCLLAHGSIDAGELVLVATFAAEVVFFFYLRLGADVEPVAARGERDGCYQCR